LGRALLGGLAPPDNFFKERIIDMTKFNEAIAALKEEYELKLAEKEAENARLRGEKKGADERAREAAKEYEKYLNEYISVKLFKDNDRYRDDVYVAVNGQNCIIKRGEWVKIKRKFALVLDASEIQDMKTAEFIEREQKRFTEAN
jgi:hypothetical protein